MKSLEAVLFDLDGVLVDSYQVWFRLMNAAAVRFRAEPVSASAFRAMWGQGVDADAEHLGCTVDQLEGFYNDHFMSFGDAMAIDPAAGPVLERVRAAGLKTALVTNTPTPLAGQILAAAQLECDAVVGGTDVPSPKPAPDMVLRACVLLGVLPSKAVMVGDSGFDREAAAGANVRFVGVRIDGYRRVERLGELVDALGLG